MIRRPAIRRSVIRRPEARWLRLLALLAVATWVAEPVFAWQELWRGSPGGAERCRIALSSDGPVEVSAVGGPATLSGTGSDLRLEAGVDGGRHRLRVTGRGALELRLPAGCDVSVETATEAITYWAGPEPKTTVRVATSGEITVDFSVDIDYRPHQEPAKFGLLHLGPKSRRAARQVDLTSRRGAISVLTQPRPEDSP